MDFDFHLSSAELLLKEKIKGIYRRKTCKRVLLYQTMTQSRRESSVSLALDFAQSTSPSQGVVLQRRLFHHALGSGRRKSGVRRGDAEEAQNTESDEVLLINVDAGSVVGHDRTNSEELTCCTSMQYMIKLARKHRMRDQFGDIVPNKRKARLPASMARLPSFKWNAMEGLSRVTLNIRSLKFGTLNLNFRGPITISVDYIDIPDKVQIAASELIRCEWCMAHRLPALFLQTTAAEQHRLRDSLSMSTDARSWSNCQSQKEKYIVIIFESEPTMLEKTTLEEIFAEIGRLNYISNFPAMLTFGEANDRLTAYEQSHKNEVVLLGDEVDGLPPSPFTPKSEMATLEVLDSEDDNVDMMACPSSWTQPVKKLVVYPPPPAKGGFSITEEDLSCLDEGEFLNDVIIDFYLKYLVCEKLQKEDANRCHVFSSFFYKSLTQKDQDTTSVFQPPCSIKERRHNRVKTWTRHLDLFEKDFIFVPINESAHWYLTVICFPGQVLQCSALGPLENVDYTPSPSLQNPMSLFYRQMASEQHYRRTMSIGELDMGFCFLSDDDLEDEIQDDFTPSGNIFNTASKRPCILIMDSLSCRSRPMVVKMLQEYLEMEWWVKKGSWQSFTNGAMNGWSLQVPQQHNHTDCGVYLLQYVESFLMSPPQILHSAMDLSDWFPQKLVKKKRKKIKKLIFRLHLQQQQQQQQLLDLGD
ncbi:sentrin-specific protease 6 isoform X3 [Pygocentrus nattereri]|nr:sentrin-specific protease 6 isoform X3 [Pygocentrus nattereri]